MSLGNNFDKVTSQYSSKIWLTYNIEDIQKKKIASHDDFILNFPKKLYSESTKLTISQKHNLKRYSSWPLLQNEMFLGSSGCLVPQCSEHKVLLQQFLVRMWHEYTFLRIHLTFLPKATWWHDNWILKRPHYECSKPCLTTVLAKSN